MILKRRSSSKEESDFIDYLGKILKSQKNSSRQISDVTTVLTPFWENSDRGGGNAVLTGFYQIFRREKPLDKEANSELHEISVELLFIDAENLRAILFSGTRAVYVGTIHINPIRILHAMVVRRDPRKAGPAFRTFYMPKCEESPFNTCVMLMDGFISGRPLSSDCVTLYLDEDEHSDLYYEFKANQRWAAHSSVEETTVISDYLVDGSILEYGNIKGRKSKYPRDFPLLKYMIDNPKESKKYFKEPTRCLQVDTMAVLFNNAQLRPFRWSDDQS